MADTNSWNYYGNTGGLAVKSKYSSNSGNNNIQDQLRDDAVATAQSRYMDRASTSFKCRTNFSGLQ